MQSHVNFAFPTKTTLSHQSNSIDTPHLPLLKAVIVAIFHMSLNLDDQIFSIHDGHASHVYEPKPEITEYEPITTLLTWSAHIFSSA